MAAAELDNLAVEVEVNSLRGRIGGEVEDDREGGRNAVLDCLFELAEKVEFRADRHVPHRSACHDEAECMDWIARVRGEHDVARCGDCLGEVGEPFLRAEGDNDFTFRIKIDSEAARVISCASASQTGDAARYRVAVSSRVLHGLDELGNDMRRRRAVGITHAKIDHVAPGGARAGF